MATDAAPPSAGGPSLGHYLESLAAAVPAPGGGSATGLAGALGAALVCMVANFTTGRPRYAGVEAQIHAALEEATAIRLRLIRLVEQDEAAFEAVAAARKQPRRTDEEKRARDAAIQHATREAATPPLEMAAVCRRVLELSHIVAEHGNPYLASDAGVAALLGEAALRASAINVRVNLASLADEAFVTGAEARLNALLEGTPSLKEEVLAIAGRRMMGG